MLIKIQMAFQTIQISIKIRKLNPTTPICQGPGPVTAAVLQSRELLTSRVMQTSFHRDRARQSLIWCMEMGSRRRSIEFVSEVRNSPRITRWFPPPFRKMSPISSLPFEYLPHSHTLTPSPDS